MARAYAVFDPDLSVTNLDNSGYQKVYIGANGGTKAQLAAAATLLRDGLIASQSALSNAVYAVLDEVNENGGRGVIIPSDVITRTGGNLSWTNVYTSSVAGIKTPSDYSTRPPVSPLPSTAASLIGPADPIDAGTISDGLYLSASNAVGDILNNKIQAAIGNTTNNGPFSSRFPACEGYETSRSLSIFYDKNQTHFGWDTYRPGNVSISDALGGPFIGGGSVSRGSDFEHTISLTSAEVSDRYSYLFVRYAILIGPSPATTEYYLSSSAGVPLGAKGPKNPGTQYGPLTGTSTISFKIPANTLAAGNYQIKWMAYFRDTSFPTFCESPCSTGSEDSTNPCFYQQSGGTWLTMTA